ncbi:MAG: c-type cytochrome [Sphingomicrobium sp.]
MMRTWLMAVAVLALAACDRTPDKPAIEAQPIVLAYDGAGSQDPAALIAHGERLTKVLGCRGCHGDNLQGEKFADEPGFGTIHASNLTLALQRYDSAGIERALRQGRRPDGSELWAMPSEMYTHLSAPDMAALVAYLKSLKPAGKAMPPKRIEAGWRAEIASGKFKSAPGYIAEEQGIAPIDLGPTHARARMIAMTACSECHASRLEGGDGTPNLDIVGAYSGEQFATLMRTGKPVGGRELRMMSGVARGRFTHFTNREIADLHAYLKARADRPQ